MPFSSAWAAAAILLVMPEALPGASFQMSFAAVIALVAVYEGLAHRISLWSRGANWFRRGLVYGIGLALTSVVATIATTPFAVYNFNRIALYGVLANLIAVPLSAFWIMPLAIAAFLLMPLGLEGLALAPMGWGIEILNQVAREVAELPGATAIAPAMPGWAIGAIALGGLWICLWRTPWRWGGLVPVAIGLAVLAFIRPPDMLVGGSGKLIGLRTADGTLALSSLKAERIAAETWLRRAGEEEAVDWPDSGEITCDRAGCVMRHGARLIAVVKERSALAEDCKVAAVLIAVMPVRRHDCPAPELVIDRFKLWREGAHALWFDEAKIRVETVAEGRGVRPWTGGYAARRAQ